MTKERLDALLSSGAITREDYDGIAKSIQPEPGQDEPDSEENKPETAAFDEDRLEKIIQSKVDKITSQLGKEKAELQKKLEKLKKEKLTDEEMKQIEISEKEKEIEEREKSLKDKENRLYAIKAIKAAGLDDGSDRSLRLVDFVLCGEEADIDERVKVFSELVKSYVQASVDKTFKANGREPEKGGATGGGANPYAEGSYNFTEQMRLEIKNPELAAKLKAAAGVKQ